MKTFVIALALGLLEYGRTNAASLKKIYLDEAKNIHVVTLDGRDMQLTTGGHRAMAGLSPDGETAAWIVSEPWTSLDETGTAGGELAVYRNGTIRSIKCEPYIREYWFWMKGNRIAIDCGGRHFAGREILYDIDTLKAVASFEQADVPTEKRPRWSATSDQFSPDE